MKCKILSDKTVKLLSTIVDSNVESGPPTPADVTSEECSSIFNHNEESSVYTSQITWILKRSQFDEIKSGQSIESSPVEVNALDIHSLYLKFYPNPNERNCFLHSIFLDVIFKNLPNDIFIFCEIAFVTSSRKVALKRSWFGKSLLKNNKIHFHNLCTSDYLKDNFVKGMVIVHCRIKLFSKFFNCISGQHLYAVKVAPQINYLYQRVLEKSKYSDVTLAVDSYKVEAHKFILASKSLSLRVLLKLNNESTQELDDVKYKVIKELLKFIYSGDFQIFDFHHAMTLYVVSSKYEIDNLKELCSTYMIAGLADENIPYLWDLSRNYKDKRLFEACTEFIKTHDIVPEKFFKGKKSVFSFK